jgi:hypothetical protein
MRVASRVLGRGALLITLYSFSYHKKALVKVVQICDLNRSERKETITLLTTEFFFYYSVVAKQKVLIKLTYREDKPHNRREA